MTLGDFSNQAQAYSRSRPTYPLELVDELISDAGLQSGDAVADFGAGTGIFTRLLTERGLHVSAIEPNRSMRDQADLPEAKWIDGTFEASGLADASQDWAVAAQAFHWADPPRCLPEVGRILKPGSLFTVLWNDREKGKSEILDWTEAAIRRFVPEFDEAYRKRTWTEILQSTGDFRFVVQRVVSHSVLMSRDRFLDLWKSHNRLNTIAGPDRFAAFFNALTAYLEQNGCQEIEVPYVCRAWSVRRVD